MTVYRDVESFAGQTTSKTPVEKAQNPDLGMNIISQARYTNSSSPNKNATRSGRKLGWSELTPMTSRTRVTLS
ncbi:MAG: hypothetical protein ACI8Z1_003463 [Candidatus Azotimanducaceae bacterium]|jgi:hypothetical protein